jgi:hypothetical protein
LQKKATLRVAFLLPVCGCGGCFFAGWRCAYPAYISQYKKGDPKVAFFCLVAEKLIKP